MENKLTRRKFLGVGVVGAGVALAVSMIPGIGGKDKPETGTGKPESTLTFTVAAQGDTVTRQVTKRSVFGDDT